MTIETKTSKSGLIIVKVDGKRAKFDEAASLIGNIFKSNLEIRTDRNVTYTQTRIEQTHAVYFKDSTGNLYKFDYFSPELTLRHIACGDLQRYLYKTATELEQIAATNAETNLPNIKPIIRNRFYKEDDNGNLIQISYEQMQAEGELALAKFCGFTLEEYAAFKAECPDIFNADSANNTASEEIMSTPLVTVEAQDAATDAEIELANKRAKKLYVINPVINGDSPIIFNRIDIYLKDNGALQLGGYFLCKNIETAYRRFQKCMAQAAYDLPQLKGWDNWLPAKKISAENGHFFNENGDLLFCSDPRDSLAVDINEDTFYFFANFSPTLKPLDGFNYDAATEYQPQTEWENPHDFTVTGDLSDRNLNGRIAAFNHKEEVTLTDNINHDDFNAKLRDLQAKAADAKAAELQALLPQNFEIIFDYIDHNFIVSTINGTSRELFDTYDTPEQLTDAIDFEQHLLALQKEQEDAYPEEVKALNRDLAQSNLTAPNMHLHIYNNDFHIGSFCGVELSKLHVKSFVTDKIHFNVCYASEPLEHYDTFEEVTAAINHFKDAISRGDKEFTFPTVDELNLPKHTFKVGANYFSRDFNHCAYAILKRTKKMLTVVFKGFENYDDCIVRAKIRHDVNGEYFTVKEEVGVNVSCEINVHAADILTEKNGELNKPVSADKHINDSLIRAMETCLLNIQAHLLNKDINAAVAELNLYHICDNALLRKEVA